MIDKSVHPMVTRLLEPLRSSPCTERQMIILAAQFVAWREISDRLPKDLQPQASLMTAEGIATVFSAIRQHDALNGDGDAFLVDSFTHSVSDLAFLQLWKEADDLHSAGFNGYYLAEKLLGALAIIRSAENILAEELVNVLIGLASLKSGDDLYTPFDEYLQISLAALDGGIKIYPETQSSSPLPHIINIIAGQEIVLPPAHDIFSRPAYTIGKKLRIFAKSIATATRGRTSIDYYRTDIYNRYGGKTTSTAVLAIRHILAHTSEKIVLLVDNSLLSAAGTDERAIREELFKSGLESVIGLPTGINGLSIRQCCILVINRQNTDINREIVFVDGDSPKFHQRDGKNRTTLTGWEDLIISAQRGKAAENVFLIPAAKIISSDYQLSIARYTNPTLDEKINDLLSRHQAHPLEDIVEFIRPTDANPVSEDSVQANIFAEVGSSDLPAYGYIRNPDKMVEVDSRKGALKANDILMAVKGIVGLIGIVPPDQPVKWVASQSILALRIKQNIIAPEALFMHLKSKIGRAMLKRITTGSVVPLIQLRELRKLLIPVPSLQEQQEAVEAFRKLAELQDQIDELRAQQAQTAASVW